MPLDLSIICVNWNSVAYLRACLASVYETTRGVSFEVVVVDNTSPDADVLDLEFPAIRLIRSPVNLGFAGACNLGFRHSGGENVLFLNPDTVLISPAISLMLGALRSLPDAGIVGCKLLNSDLSVQTQSIQRFPRLLNQLFDVEILRLKWPGCRLFAIAPLFGKASGPLRVEVISGACQMLRREVFEAAGLYPEDYFMYAEDIDLNYEVAALGLGSYYVGEAVVIHHGGQSSRQQASQWATRMKFRAMVALYRRRRGSVYSNLYRALMVFAATIRLAALGLVFPIALAKRKRDSVRIASVKWFTVLRCAVGLAE